ncbi:hypothetical protein MUN78_04435 [Leucobacter allii]|uniref:Head-tail adaptor protein n=1 Tax=Leucobacter allii TaxID=2932247 RepID=A0ABY4FP95_9MICO|nr:hypothetical protein [Leucobacter allii]UOQ58099.1 hypothetical protein MUN78_04435 [Leucobacter allii]
MLLPHRGLVVVEPYLGGAANRRIFGPPATIERALIVDSDELVRDQYDAEVVASTTIYLERAATGDLPAPETRVTVRAGTADERVVHVIRCDRYEHPDIADLLEVRLR